MKTNRCTSKMETQICLRLVLVAPPVGVDFGIQHGKGRDYTTIQKQRSKGADLRFDCVVTVKGDREEVVPNFVGPLTQGPATSRFIYIDVGKLAGQPDSCWERRIKVPLGGITWEMIEKVSTDSKLVLEAHLRWDSDHSHRISLNIHQGCSSLICRIASGPVARRRGPASSRLKTRQNGPQVYANERVYRSTAMDDEEEDDDEGQFP